MTYVKYLLSVAVFLVLFSSNAHSQQIKSRSYGEHSRQKLDVLSPVGAQKLPVLVFLHGGGWIRGDKSKHRFIQHRLVKEDIVTVSANYRLSPEAVFPDFVDDGAAVVSWVVNNIAEYGGDPENIYLMGHSAGAHTVAMLGLDERYLEKAGVDRSVIKGVIPIAAPLLLKASQIPQLSFVFGTAKDEDMWPLGFIDGDEPPFLLLQGERDPLVQPIHSRIAEKMIKEKGGEVKAYFFKDHDHMSIIRAFESPYERRGNVVDPIMAMISGK